MAYGRKDYFWGVAPDKSVFGEQQTPWNYYGANTVLSGATTEVLIYPVSAGFNLLITGFLFSCTEPFMNYATVWFDAVPKLIVYFDTILSMPFGEGGNLLVTGGQILYVKFQNNDSIDATFVAHGYGFLQQTVV